LIRLRVRFGPYLSTTELFCGHDSGTFIIGGTAKKYISFFLEHGSLKRCHIKKECCFKEIIMVFQWKKIK
jgi:hypothetical protein